MCYSSDSKQRARQRDISAGITCDACPGTLIERTGLRQIYSFAVYIQAGRTVPKLDNEFPQRNKVSLMIAVQLSAPLEHVRSNRIG